jgi:hypothetical protein
MPLLHPWPANAYQNAMSFGCEGDVHRTPLSLQQGIKMGVVVYDACAR